MLFIATRSTYKVTTYFKTFNDTISVKNAWHYEVDNTNNGSKLNAITSAISTLNIDDKVIKLKLEKTKDKYNL